MILPAPSELLDKWWLHLQGERVYYLQCGGAKLSFVIGEVDYLYDSGYRVINVFVPYHGEKPATDGAPSYCGLAPINYYNVDPSHGSNEEWAELIETAHTKGMALMTWINLGYTSSMSDYWRQAQEDKAAGLATKHSNSFIWLDEESQLTDDVASSAYSEIAGSWYRTAWGQPAYN